MLNKPLYEALPYAYIGTGSLVLLTQDHLLSLLGGLLLYVMGAAIWIMRARHRSPVAAGQPRKRKLPQGLYEAAPFLYLLAGLLCAFTYLQLPVEQLPPMTLVAATLFGVAGLGSWVMRARHRGYHRAG